MAGPTTRLQPEQVKPVAKALELFHDALLWELELNFDQPAEAGAKVNPHERERLVRRIRAAEALMDRLKPGRPTGLNRPETELLIEALISINAPWESQHGDIPNPNQCTVADPCRQQDCPFCVAKGLTTKGGA